MRHAIAAILLTLSAGLPVSAAAAPPAVELTELPNRLELPLPAGTNRIFAVKVSGQPKAVWMAPTQAAEARLPLQPMGGKWVFNLGDPRVAEVVAGATQFQVFARVGGEVGASLPVQFIAARKAAVAVDLRDADGTRLPSSGWVDPGRVAALNVRWTGRGTRVPAVIVAGERKITVAPDGDPVQVKLDDALRAAWRSAGTLQLVDGDGNARDIAGAVPGALADVSRQPFRVVQRRSLAVPGSRDFLTVHLGDISGTRVPVTLTGADGTVFFEQRLLSQGDRAEFALGDGAPRYVLVIDRLVNMMLGDDHAELRVEPASAKPTE